MYAWRLFAWECAKLSLCIYEWMFASMRVYLYLGFSFFLLFRSLLFLSLNYFTLSFSLSLSPVCFSKHMCMIVYVYVWMCFYLSVLYQLWGGLYKPIVYVYLNMYVSLSLSVYVCKRFQFDKLKKLNDETVRIILLYFLIKISLANELLIWVKLILKSRLTDETMNFKGWDNR